MITPQAAEAEAAQAALVKAEEKLNAANKAKETGVITSEQVAAVAAEVAAVKEKAKRLAKADALITSQAEEAKAKLQAELQAELDHSFSELFPNWKMNLKV